MKKLIIAGLTSLVILSGVALAGQSGEQKEGSSMRGMVEEMMGGEKSGGGMGGMQGMMGMMNMMGQMDKMMDQCVSAHESMHGEAKQAKEGGTK